MKVSLYRIVLWIGLSAMLICGPTAMAKSTEFETRSLTLYDIGVMQVKKEAVVDGRDAIELSVPSAHLDDVLNSLLVTSVDDVQIIGVDYPTVKNIAQAVASGSIGQSLTDEDGEPAFPNRFSETIKLYVGVKVRLLLEKRKPAKLEGTVMGVVEDDGGGTVPVPENVMAPVNKTTPVRMPLSVALLTDRGTLLNVPLKHIRGVELQSSSEAIAINDLARELGKSNGFEEKTVTIRMESGARGALAAEFVQQAPTWRMWYRLIHHSDGLYLEGWAQVHNDTGEDWNAVQMMLISGSPDSYLVSVASPRYGVRDSIELQNDGAMMPQLGAQTADRLLYDYHSGQGYMSGVGNGYGRGAGGLGGRRGLSPSIRDGAVDNMESPSTLINIGESAVKEMASAAVDAEIATYEVLTPVSVSAGSSAMVPVLNRKITGQLFSRVLPGAQQVDTCVRLQNETGVVLQSGLMSVFVDNRFRGQSELMRTEPNTAAIMCYGKDEDVTFESSVKTVSSETKHLEWKYSALYAHKLVKRALSYELKNKSGQIRTLGVLIGHNKNGRIVTRLNVVAVDERSNAYLTFVTVGARADKRVTLVTEEGIQTKTDMSISTLQQLASQTGVPENERAVIKDVISVQTEIGKRNARLALNTQRIAWLEKRIKSDRTNLASLPKMWGRKRIARKLLASILEHSDEIGQLENLNDSVKDGIKKLEQKPEKLLLQLQQ